MQVFWKPKPARLALLTHLISIHIRQNGYKKEGFLHKSRHISDITVVFYLWE